jgi:hypothetical protein
MANLPRVLSRMEFLLLSANALVRLEYKDDNAS